MSKKESKGYVINYNIQTTSTNNTSHKKTSKAGKISGLINLKSLLPIMIVIPIVIYLLLALFDLNNITLFKTRVVNGIELTYFDTLAYVKNLEQSGADLKAMLKNLALDTLNLPSIGTIELPFDTPNWLEYILKAMILLPNIAIWVINIFIFLPLRAIISVFYFLPVALKTILSLLAIDTQQNFILNGTYQTISQVLNLLTHIQIPYIGM